MADYSERFTKRVKTSGDLQITAGSDVRVEPEGNLSMSTGGNMNLTSSGSMTFTDTTTSTTLSAIVNETVHNEIEMNGQVSAGVNGKLDSFEQEFTDTSGGSDYLEVSFLFVVQDVTNNQSAELTLILQKSVDGGSYTQVDSIPLVMNEVEATFSVPMVFSRTIPIAAGTTVRTRLLKSQGAEGEILNSASSFKIRHVTKHHPYTLYGGGAWESV
jgi:hypothetical protein